MLILCNPSMGTSRLWEGQGTGNSGDRIVGRGRRAIGAD